MTCMCPKCFADAGLGERIQELIRRSPGEACDFHPESVGIPVEDIVGIVDAVFRLHYGIGDSGYPGEQHGDGLEFCVGDMVGADENIAALLATALAEEEDCWPPDGDEPFYDRTQNYVRIQPRFSYHSTLWRTFCESIVHDQRFFNAPAKQMIAEIFDGIHTQIDSSHQKPVYRINPDTPEAQFFRARVASTAKDQGDIMRNPAKELGPPPKRRRRAGRMNPAGVVCFYGAYDLKTCIAELHPPVGSIVIGAQFRLIRPIYVLDTTRFSAPMPSASPFSQDYIDRMEQWTFMQKFRTEIAKPILPDDEHLDYIPTQAVAEYLLNQHTLDAGAEGSRIEGIIFWSAQNPAGKNIAIFGEAAAIRSHEPAHGGHAMPAFGTTLANLMNHDWKREHPALRIDTASIEERKVRSVSFASYPILSAHNLDDGF